MGKKLFIPITDEVLYEHPELITSPLRPYRTDDPCFHWMARIESVEGELKQSIDHRMLMGKSVDQRSSRFA